MRANLPSTGIDLLLEDESLIQTLARKRIGLVTNQSALTKDLKPTAKVLSEKLGDALTCILTPEHGWGASAAEGEKVKDGICPGLGLPIYSLYGGDKKQLESIQAHLDVLLIDLQDVGVRCYTYTATCAKLLEKIAGSGKDVIVCDRPNPLGPQKKGPDLEPHYRSLLAYVDVPFQHGQTLGELLQAHNQILKKGSLPLKVFASQRFHQPYHYPWIPPSPNLPSWDSVLLYPALVLLEGTNVSEGRGTALPFTCLGAPNLDSSSLVEFLNETAGIRGRPISFTPQSGELAGQGCEGAHLLLTNPSEIDAFSLGVKMIHFLKKTYPPFKWTEMVPQKGTYFIDYLLGTSRIREAIEEGVPPSKILKDLKRT